MLVALTEPIIEVFIVVSVSLPDQKSEEMIAELKEFSDLFSSFESNMSDAQIVASRKLVIEVIAEEQEPFDRFIAWLRAQDKEVITYQVIVSYGEEIRA